MGYRWTTALHVVASITTLATVATVIVVGHGRLRPGRSTCSPIPETGPMPTKVLLAQDDMQLKQFGTDRKSPAAVIVFLHGHLGSFVQGQPFADRARSLGLNLAVCSLDQGEFRASAFDAYVAMRQVVFARQAIATLRQRFPSAPITVVGHSMGGIVARAAVATMTEDTLANIPLLVTLNSPLRLHPFLSDAYFLSLYRSNLSNSVTQVSIVTGHGDAIVHSSMSAARDITAFSSAIPGVWSEMSHDDILACKELVDVVLQSVMTAVALPSRHARVHALRSILLESSSLSQHRSEVIALRKLQREPAAGAAGGVPVILSGQPTFWSRMLFDGLLPTVSTVRVDGARNAVLRVVTDAPFTGESRWLTQADDPSTFLVAMHPGLARSLSATLFISPPQRPYSVSVSIDVISTLFQGLRFGGPSLVFPPLSSILLHRLSGSASHFAVPTLGLPLLSWLLIMLRIHVEGDPDFPVNGLIMVTVGFWVALAAVTLIVRIPPLYRKRRPRFRLPTWAMFVSLLLVSLVLGPWACTVMVLCVAGICIPKPHRHPVVLLYAVVSLLKVPAIIAAVQRTSLTELRWLRSFHYLGPGVGGVIGTDALLAVPIIVHLMVLLRRPHDALMTPGRHTRTVVAAACLLSCGVHSRLFETVFIISAVACACLADHAVDVLDARLRTASKKATGAIPVCRESQFV